MLKPQALSGLILAGGRASRMQRPGAAWVDKGLVELNGKPLIAAAYDYLCPRVGRLFISANANAQVYAKYGVVVPDDSVYGGFAGPLAGIASVLCLTTTSWLMVIPVDVVGLPDDLFDCLYDAVGRAGAQVAYARAEQAHPLCMLVHRDRLISLKDYLRSGERRVMGWLEVNQACGVDFAAGPGRFRNINSVDDLVG